MAGFEVISILYETQFSVFAVSLISTRLDTFPGDDSIVKPCDAFVFSRTGGTFTQVTFRRVTGLILGCRGKRAVTCIDVVRIFYTFLVVLTIFVFLTGRNLPTERKFSRSRLTHANGLQIPHNTFALRPAGLLVKRAAQNPVLAEGRSALTGLTYTHWRAVDADALLVRAACLCGAGIPGTAQWVVDIPVILANTRRVPGGSLDTFSIGFAFHIFARITTRWIVGIFNFSLIYAQTNCFPANYSTLSAAVAIQLAAGTCAVRVGSPASFAHALSLPILDHTQALVITIVVQTRVIGTGWFQICADASLLTTLLDTDLILSAFTLIVIAVSILFPV